MKKTFKPARGPVKKKVKDKKLSKALHIAAVKKAKAAALKRAKHPAAVKKRTLSLGNRPLADTDQPRWKEMLVKLGRNPATPDKPRLELDAYLNAEELATPSVVDFASEVVSWPMYGNDTIGDCTAACVGHQIQAWTCYTGTEVDIPEPDIIQLYSAVSGYIPGKPSTDQGATVQDTLAYMRKNGVPVAGHQILAFAQLKDLSKIHDALWMFGSVYLGFDCPGSALQQFDNDEPWDVVAHSAIVGGHAVPVQYAGTGSFPYQVVTWGKLQGMSQAFLSKYVEEAWVVITNDWLDKNGHTPEGLDLYGLGQEMASLTGEPNPFPPPPGPEPTPAPEPTPVPVPPAPVPDPGADIKADLEILEQDIGKTIQDVEKVL